MFNKILIGAVLAVLGMVSTLEAMEEEMGEPAVPGVAASLEAMEGEMGEPAAAPRVEDHISASRLMGLLRLGRKPVLKDPSEIKNIYLTETDFHLPQNEQADILFNKGMSYMFYSIFMPSMASDLNAQDSLNCYVLAASMGHEMALKMFPKVERLP